MAKVSTVPTAPTAPTAPKGGNTAAGGEKHGVRVVAVDATWLLHRAFHVRPSGVPYMTFGWVCQYALQYQATHIIPCFDTGKSFRHDVYPGYKAARNKNVAPGAPRPSDYVDSTVAFLRKAGFDVLLGNGFEADDLLKTVGELADSKIKTILVTPDKDNLQGISENCVQVRPGVAGNPDVVWDLKRLLTETGFTPRQYRDHQILIGDDTDCIPKILTPAKAKKIILEHGSLGKFFSTKEGEKFYWDNRSALVRNRQLVSLLNECCTVDLSRHAVEKIRRTPRVHEVKSTWYLKLLEKPSAVSRLFG